jgi:hypothetical protein
MNTHITFWKEYKTAHDAQVAGLEGRARVCARRAAGLLIQKFLETQRIIFPKMNSLDLIKYLQQTTDSPELVLLLSHYSEKVTFDHQLGSNFDLVENLPLLAKMLKINLRELD